MMTHLNTTYGSGEVAQRCVKVLPLVNSGLHFGLLLIKLLHINCPIAADIRRMNYFTHFPKLGYLVPLQLVVDHTDRRINLQKMIIIMELHLE